MITIESLAGVPEAAEITRLANELFPDLTESIYGVPNTNVPAVPDVSAGENVVPSVPEISQHQMMFQQDTVPLKL